MIVSNSSLPKSFISELIANCLTEPGDYICQMYRTDGITQGNTIEQLYANFYRSEPYTYMISTPHEQELKNVEQFLCDNKAEILAHIQEKHNLANASPEKAFMGIKCDCEYCIGNILSIMIDRIEQYANQIKVSLFIHEDSELLDKILTMYNTYISFIVVLENSLPTLSELISKIPSEKYPFSLWKFLHKQFLSKILEPTVPQLIEIVSKGIKNARINAIERTIKCGKDKEIPLDDFENICQLRAIVELITSSEIDEKSVHFLEATIINEIPGYSYNESYELIEQFIKKQTEEMYAEYNKKPVNGLKWKTIISNDLQVLEKTLMPRSIKTEMEHCVKIAKEMWELDESLLENRFVPFHLKDLEVEYYAKKLGVMA